MVTARRASDCLASRVVGVAAALRHLGSGGAGGAGAGAGACACAGVFSIKSVVYACSRDLAANSSGCESSTVCTRVRRGRRGSNVAAHDACVVVKATAPTFSAWEELAPQLEERRHDKVDEPRLAVPPRRRDSVAERRHCDVDRLFSVALREELCLYELNPLHVPVKAAKYNCIMHNKTKSAIW
jgi:hypothetical protein